MYFSYLSEMNTYFMDLVFQNIIMAKVLSGSNVMVLGHDPRNSSLRTRKYANLAESRCDGNSDLLIVFQPLTAELYCAWLKN